jgi:hypothetical protein
MFDRFVTYGYVSRSLLPPETAAEELRRIVAHSARSNRRLGISGALILAGGRFAQIVEGPGEHVEELRSRLAKDPRHDRLVRLELSPAAERRFGRWALAYAGGAEFFADYLERLHEGRAEDGDADRLAGLLQKFVEGQFELVDDFVPEPPAGSPPGA